MTESSPPEIVVLESAKDARHPSPQREQRSFMDKNFGIGFYFSTVFRTMAKRIILQLDGYQAAIERYGLDETELVSLRGCSKALFHKDERNSGNRSKLELQIQLHPPRWKSDTALPK